MNYIKRIVCLANSEKHGGRCVAGREITSNWYGPWIRPISSRPSAEVALPERRTNNGRAPELLDVIDITMSAPAPAAAQSENHIIDANVRWVEFGKLGDGELLKLVESPAGLWTNGNSSYNGQNDRVTIAQASQLNNSLTLIEPDHLSLSVETEGKDSIIQENESERISPTAMLITFSL
jgi:hypothetical protein